MAKLQSCVFVLGERVHMLKRQTGPVMGDNAEAVLCGLRSFFCMPWHFIGALVFRTVVSYIGKCTSS